jgi:LysR family cys regulon transcriptional activator
MRIGHIKSFLNHILLVALIKEYNFNISLTASEINLSQPGISKKISKLEDYLGYKIFESNGKRLIGFTERGESLITFAENILENAIAVEQLKL